MASGGLECDVCCENFDGQDLIPRQLSCGHSFCSGCLDRLTFENPFCCPSCREEINVPQAGVEGFPKNYALLSIIQNSEPQHERSEGLPICEVCARDNRRHPAKSYCLDCDDDMCSDAVRFHNSNKTSHDHKVFVLEPSVVSLCCSKHEEKVRLFDESCRRMICRSCITSGHCRDHSIMSLAKAASQCKQEMKELANKVSSRTDVVKDAEARVMNSIQDAEKSRKEQLSGMESVYGELRTTVTAREKNVTDKLEQLHMSKAVIFTKQIDNLRGCQENIESGVQGVLSTIQSLDNASLLDTRSSLESTLDAIEKESYTVLELEEQSAPVFTFNRNSFQYVREAVNKVGTVSDESTCAETTTAAGSGLERAKPEEMASFVITARDAQNRVRNLGGDEFEVNLESESGEKVSAYVQDKDDGIYCVSYTIPACDKRVDYTLSVKLRGVHIQGSPFTVQVSSSLRRKSFKALSNAAGKFFQN